MKTPPYREMVYQPEEDTMLLLEAAEREANPGDRIIEVGTGSGLIASRMNAVSDFVIATDINPHACRSASSTGVETVQTDFFSGICSEFDLVLFNPPYLPTREEERIDDWLEYALDGGKDGRDTIRRFAGQLPAYLSFYGRCLMLISSLTGTDEVREIFSELGFITLIVSEKVVEDEVLIVIRIARDLCNWGK